MSARNFELSNLTVIVDCNGIQSDGFKKDVMNQFSLTEKFSAFGFNTIEINGHDHDAILDAFNNKDLSRPNAIIAKTIKGKGISFMENDVLWHHGVLSQVQFDKAIEELNYNIMVEINKLSSYTFSKLGQSGAAFGIGLLEANKSIANIKVISADMSRPAGLGRFINLFPNQFFNVGIAEQNAVGIAAGMSSEGNNVIVTAQAVFITMRSFEQVRQYFGYMKLNATIVGVASGFGLTFFGNTHYAIEDIALMRSIPGMTVLSPSDAGQAAKMIVAAIQLDTPVYIRFTGSLNCPIVYKEEFDYEIGKAIKVKDGLDITIFATGLMVYNSIKAAELLEKHNISVRIIDMHTIKPIDSKTIQDCFDSNLFVSIEEHNIIGGLGTAISDFLSETSKHPTLLKLGIKDQFSHPGEYEYLIQQNRLDFQSIAEDILVKYNTL
jgi:transketolase